MVFKWEKKDEKESVLCRAVGKKLYVGAEIACSGAEMIEKDGVN